MSHLETRFDKIEDILHTLVGKATIGSPATPPPASSTAGTDNSVPAAGGESGTQRHANVLNSMTGP